MAGKKFKFNHNLKGFLSFFLSQGDFFYGKNLAIATKNNQYLDGLGAVWLPQLLNSLLMESSEKSNA